jgi:pyruvate, orthophosphate dikinase
VLTADEAVLRAAAGIDVILVRPGDLPDDVEGMVASKGLLTSRGGLVSHAAVVARGFGIPAVCGASALQIDTKGGPSRSATPSCMTVTSSRSTAPPARSSSVRSSSPRPTTTPASSGCWSGPTSAARIGIRANADTPDDGRRARANGAEGIGLCRTEHQFLGDRLPLVQRVILSEDDETEAEALVELEKQQLEDFTELLEVMDGLPVNVRLLDPPLHEFLPNIEELLVLEATGKLDAKGLKLLAAAQEHREHDPMLGTRGIRLGVLRPALYRTQVRALIAAAIARKRAGGDPRVEIMLPLISTEAELVWAVALVKGAAAEVMDREGLDVAFHIATMIETPRAALVAGKLAPHVDVFSFGTNDLTQMTFGLSRDDVAARLMPRELELGLLPADPFRTLDDEGVGLLIRNAVEAARAANPDIEIGVCGEHGGDPESIKLIHAYGLDYASSSSARLPVARLAAAHAALEVTGPAHTA